MTRSICIRIPVIVGPKGQFYACQAWETIGAIRPGHVLHYVVADVPMPDEAEIPGRIDPAPDAMAGVDGG